MRYDAVIVGGGPAGLSAALVLGRSRRNVLVLDDGRPRNSSADVSYGFLTRDGERPRELLRLARRDLARYPTVAIADGSAISARRLGDAFTVQLASGVEVSAQTLLLATGVFDQLPDIAGLRERWGKTVFVCPFCDGWELRDQRVAVYGRGRDAVELAREVIGWTRDLLVCSDQTDLTSDDRHWLAASNARLRTGQLTSISGRTSALLTFDDGTVEECKALFLSAPLRQHSPLFASLGCALDADAAVLVDNDYQTTVDGVFAAGDAVTQRHQVVIAAASGAAAAMSLNCTLLEAEARALIAQGAR